MKYFNQILEAKYPDPASVDALKHELQKLDVDIVDVGYPDFARNKHGNIVDPRLDITLDEYVRDTDDDYVDRLMKDADKILNPLGWFVTSTNATVETDKNQLLNIVIEPYIGFVRKKWPKYLYHFSPKRSMDNILKYGLLSVSSTRKHFRYPPRVYLFVVNDRQMQRSLARSMEELGYGDRDKNIAVFRIFTEKLNKEVILFKDPAMALFGDNVSVWTYDSIPKEAIKLVYCDK